MGILLSSSARSTPTCAMPRAPPPESAKPIFGRTGKSLESGMAEGNRAAFLTIETAADSHAAMRVSKLTIFLWDNSPRARALAIQLELECLPRCAGRRGRQLGCLNSIAAGIAIESPRRFD